jgi:hypothetical protein
LVLIASIEDQFFTEIVEFERAHQIWTFLRIRYEPTGQSTFLATIIRSNFLARVMLSLMLLLDQLYAIWC